MRVCASVASSSALPAEGEDSACQVLPSRAYSQLPWLVSLATTAIPCTAAGSMSVIFPATSADTRKPLLPTLSSAMDAGWFTPASTGAVLGSVKTATKASLPWRAVSKAPVVAQLLPVIWPEV